MAPDGIVDAIDIAADRGGRLGAALEDGAPDKFALERLEERLDWTAPGPLDTADLSFEHRRLVMSSQRFAPEFKEEAITPS